MRAVRGTLPASGTALEVPDPKGIPNPFKDHVKPKRSNERTKFQIAAYYSSTMVTVLDYVLSILCWEHYLSLCSLRGLGC